MNQEELAGPSGGQALPIWLFCWARTLFPCKRAEAGTPEPLRLGEALL